MGAETIQAQYDQLATIAQRFAKSAQANTDMIGRVRRSAHALQHGGWQGMGVQGFSAEMEQTLFPALLRLTQAMQEAQATTLRISEVLRRAEDEAAEPFKMSMEHTAPASDTNASRGYIRSENQNSTSAQRLTDISVILNQAVIGQRVLRWLNDNHVTVTFGDAGGNAIAVCSSDGKRITIDRDYAYLSDYELAAVLVHEGTHSLDTHPFDVPVVGPLINAWYNIQEDVMYAAYPFPEEYRAFRAQAEFWRQVASGLPPSPILDSVESLIYDSNGSYRDIDAVYKELHNSYGYKDQLFDVFNP